MLGVSTNLLACTCEIPLLTAEINESQAIFIGKVSSIEEFDIDLYGYQERYQRAIFQQIESLKGTQSTFIEVITEIGSSCGMSFNLDSTYLVFASDNYYFDNFQDKLTTGLCSRTQPFSRSQTLLNKLHKLGKLIDIVDEIQPEQLYNEIWKGELFFSVEQNELLLLNEEEETKFVLNMLPKCPTDSSFPMNKKDKQTSVSIFFEIDQME